MLVVETIARIRREYFVKGKPIKEIVRDVKVSRNTVRKVIRSQATAFTYDRRVQPMPKLGPWTAELERMLEANETKSKRERLTLLRISEALEGLGYGGGYDAVRRYAKAWRWRRSASTAQTYVPLVFSPGGAYQFDWSHEYVVLAWVTTKVKCQWRSKKGPPRRCKKGPLGGCGLVPVVHGRAPRATRRALNRLTRRRAREGPVGPRGQAWAGWSVQLAVVV